MKSVQCSLIISLLFFCQLLLAQTFPSGFSRVKVASLDAGTAMAFAPDGRLFVCQKGGAIRIIKNGVLLSTPFLTLTVNQDGERGVSGIVLDPDFNTNNHLYIYYTATTPTLHNRLSRFTANGDVVLAGSEVALLDAETLNTVYHMGGGMVFGPDGRLYLAMGENNLPSNSQNPNVYKGKILRLNKDGSAPSDNPFISSSSPVTKRIWAYGLRNPYTMTVQPGTGKIFVNDVGADAWEEVNDATLGGRNFGWPNAEGASSNTAYTNPVFAYPHDAAGQHGCAITGGTFFNPASTNYPSQYNGKYFYMDFCNGWMYYLGLGSPVTNTFFASGLTTQNLALQPGPDGNLYYINRFETKAGIYKIIYTNNNAPIITDQPDNLTVTAGQPSSFNVSVSGATPLSYQWRKNGINISGATSSVYNISNTQSSHAGQYSVRVTNSSGTTTSNNAALTVTAFNAQPDASILTPASGTHYHAGDVISFSGNATDAEDGTLPASAFQWTVEFWHNNNHFHPGPMIPSGIKSGTFSVPNTGEPSAIVFYRLKLKVTDSHGLRDTAYMDILPFTSTVSINTQPAGLQITFDSQPKTTPFSILTVEGLSIPMGVVSPQSNSGKWYAFGHWIHGGSASQNIVVGSSDASYTAVFKDTVMPRPIDFITDQASWKYLDNGSNQGTAWRVLGYNDAGWKTGNAQLGYGDGDEATVVSYGGDPNNKFITTYFRKEFHVTNASAFSTLELSLMRDDGAVVYINGTEVYRTNLPSGTISYTTLAPTYVDGANESAWLTAAISKSALVNGTNMIAVEIHQNYRGSSDISFNLKLRGSSGISGGPTELVASKASWRYLDNGSNQGAAWRSLAFSDAAWKTGNAELGYGDGDEATVVSYGGNAGNKFITTYFRKTFTVTDPSVFSSLELNLLRDDGIVVYINGTEVARDNMPGGTIAYNTLASTNISGASGMTFFSRTISASSLVAGTNVIAAEIHQASPSSADISFNLKLVGNGTGGGCGKPVFATVDNVQSASANLSWGAVQDVIKYHLMYRVKGNTSWTEVETTSTSYTLTGLSSFTTYQWQLYAICSSGNGAVMVGAEFTTQGTSSSELVPANGSWKYLDNGSNQGTAWRSLAFSDAAWKTGNAELGYGDGDEATVVSYGSNVNNKFITTYFRKTFTVTDPAVYSLLELSLLRDDGVVVYINGMEVARDNMPGGTIEYNTLASTNISGTNGTTFFPRTISASSLVPGTNIISVEIHQASPGSADISFNLKLRGANGPPAGDFELVASNAPWRYLDNGSNQGTVWRSPAFSDAGWKTGNAELGYGDGGEATVVSYGGDPGNKYITTYFRKAFTVPDASSVSSLTLNLIRDDGVVVYLNGSEVYRNNLPGGTIAYNTVAITYIDGDAESAWISSAISKSALVTGNNVIAVEIHQNARTSSDISFNLKLSAQGATAADSASAAVAKQISESLEEPEEIIVYPNPTTGLFTLEYCNYDPQASSSVVQIINSLGQIIYEKELSPVNGCLREIIQLSNELPLGVYTMNLLTGITVQSKRVILSR